MENITPMRIIVFSLTLKIPASREAIMAQT